MSGMVAAPPIGLIDHLPDGSLGTAYPTRSVVIAGDTNFVATSSGTLPMGMAFDSGTGQVYGTPYATGVFVLTVSASSSNNPVVTKSYPFLVAPAGAAVPAHSVVDITVSPPDGGTATGTGVYTNGTTATVVATPNAGYQFVNWTENSAVLSASPSYTFTNIVNQSLVATFVAVPTLSSLTTQTNTLLLTWPTNFSSFALQQNSSLGTTNWVGTTNPVNVVGTNNQVLIPIRSGSEFFRLYLR